MNNKERGPRYHEQVRYLFNKGVRSLKEDGFVRTLSKLGRGMNSLRTFRNSRETASQPLYTEEELSQQSQRDFGREAVVFSIVVPLYNTPESFLREMIESVIAQTYAHWELCLVDASDATHEYVQECCLEYAAKDTRIAYRKLAGNAGIAGNSNVGLELATGDYVALLDHDDVLHPAALYDAAIAAIEQGADFIYTDEAIFRSPDLNDVQFVHFKPCFAPDNLRAYNYICHFVAFRRALLDKSGCFREGFEGSQDHDLVLRLTKYAQHIKHIPKVLYYWRSHEQSTAQSVLTKPFATESGKKAVLDALRADGIEARVENARGVPTIYRCIYELTSTPLVSIVIPNCDHLDDLCTCIQSIQEKSTYRNFEIIIVENNSCKLQTYEYYEELLKRYDNVKIIFWDAPFNWSAMNNYAVNKAAVGDMILLLNNDTEVISPNWLEEMIMYAQRQDVGCVGAMLYFPNNTIQHGGVIIGLDGQIGLHAFAHMKRGEVGYAGRLCFAQDVSAVTGACMLMRRAVWEEVGGCEESIPVTFNDVDLCMKIREAGYLIVWTPYAELYHYESKTRGRDTTPEKQARAAVEVGLFLERWGSVLEKGDPYYNPKTKNMVLPFTEGLTR